MRYLIIPIVLFAFSNLQAQQDEKATIEFNITYASISALALVVSYKNLKDVSDIERSIEQYSQMNLETSQLKSRRDRAMLTGIISGIVGIVNLYFTFNDLKIESDGNKINFKYFF